ncbi:MAG: hypothetical protein K6C12_05945 [Oscillospiraceae bacterium]|nr:hypothetical protein [Oscillospiraceae bacterium]
MHEMKGKIKSERGASITFALLLFLVCAVLGSVILTAATAAAGRMAGMAEMDQQYYAVSSASELLKDWLDGKETTIKQDTTTSILKTYINGIQVSATDQDVSDGYTVDGESFSPSAIPSLKSYVAYKIHQNPDTIGVKTLKISSGEDTGYLGGDLNFPTGQDPLAVNITTEIDKMPTTDGKETWRILFKIMDPNDSTDPTYWTELQRLEFHADIKRSENTSEEEDADQWVAENTYTVNASVTETNTTDISFELIRVKSGEGLS